MTEKLLHCGIDKAIEIANGRPINFSAFGGEPATESALLKEMVRYAKSKYSNSKFSITTNGLFNDSVCNFLIENNFSISLSMDGIPEVQNYQRPLPNNKNYALVTFYIKTILIKECIF